MGAEQHHQAADYLDAVGVEHHLALGHCIGKGADKGRQHHVEEREHRHQCGALPFGAAGGVEQFNGSDEQRVVSQRAEELRRHDGEEAFFHEPILNCGKVAKRPRYVNGRNSSEQATL